MVKNITLNWKHSVLASLLAGLFLYFSFPVFDFWPLSIISFSIFTFFYINLGEKKSIHSLWLFFIFTFIFWFLRRSITFESIFPTATNYFQNQLHGNVFTLLLFLLLSLYSAILNTVSLLFVQLLKNRYLKYIFIILFLMLTTELNDIYLPLPAEYILFQNKFLLASLNSLHPLFYKVGFYTSAIFLAITFGNVKSLLKVSCFICAWLMLSGYIGYINIHERGKDFSHKLNIILVQTNQSVLKQGKTSVKEYFQKVNEEINLKFKNEAEVYIFWPESFMEQSEENMKILTEFQNASLIKKIHLLGTFSISEKGIINKMILVTPEGRIKSEYIKNHLFPIGEKSIEIPFVPREWTRVNIPVLNSKTVSAMEYNGKTFLPLICYESVIETHYNNLYSLKKEKSFNVMVNISKDSFYEKTSLVKLHSLYSRVKSSILELPMIRVSTTEGTEIIGSNGDILARAKPGIESVTSYELRYSNEL